ncbi:MAG: Aerobic respiration control sensor protein ArcB [Pseudomonadota bacterium]
MVEGISTCLTIQQPYLGITSFFSPMQKLFQFILEPKLISTSAEGQNRRMAELFAWVGFVNCALVALVPMAQYPSWVLALAAALFLGMAMCMHLRPNPVWCIHAMLGLSVSLLLFLVVHTGGVVSSMTVWLSGLALIPFLLLPIRPALVWFAIQTLGLGVVLSLGFAGWAMGEADAPDMVVWAWANKVLAAVTLLAILVYLDHVQRNQLRVLQMQSDELKRTHQELLRAQSHKDEFIASVGHELRTPMNAILGLNGVLKDQLTQHPQDLDRAEWIRQSTQRLLALVNDILDFSQLQAQRMRLGSQPYALGLGVQALFARFEDKPRGAQLQMHCSIDPGLPPWVLLDARRFHQILENLLDNALKFTRAGRIDLRCMPCTRGLRVEVQDTGIGMTPAQRERVFGRFEKANADDFNLHNGTGLGLSICEKLVQLQGGQMGVSSQWGVGSTFWLEVPMSVAPAPELGAHLTSLSGTTSGLALRFLIVDDHPVNLLVAQSMVQKLWPAASVHTLSEGAQALAYLGQHPVDVVLLDMFMPDMDGLALTQAIRALPGPIHHLPVLGMTASNQSLDLQRCFEAGMNNVVLKPMDSHKLQEAVDMCFMGRSEGHGHVG